MSEILHENGCTGVARTWRFANSNWTSSRFDTAFCLIRRISICWSITHCPNAACSVCVRTRKSKMGWTGDERADKLPSTAQSRRENSPAP